MPCDDLEVQRREEHPMEMEESIANQELISLVDSSRARNAVDRLRARVARRPGRWRRRMGRRLILEREAA
jgi:hypothetical protein